MSPTTPLGRHRRGADRVRPACGTEAAAAAAARRYGSLAQLRSRYAALAAEVFYQVWDGRYIRCRAARVSECCRCAAATMSSPACPRCPAITRAVLARDPDVILIAAIGADGARQTLEWSQFSTFARTRSSRVHRGSVAVGRNGAPHPAGCARGGATCSTRHAATRL